MSGCHTEFQPWAFTVPLLTTMTSYESNLSTVYTETVLNYTNLHEGVILKMQLLTSLIFMN